MRFFSTVVSTIAALAAVTSAASTAQSSAGAVQTPTPTTGLTKANAITEPVAGAVISAGSTYDIKWTNVMGATVTLVLMDGPENSLMPVATIVAGIPNSGEYPWSVPTDIPASGTYAIRIQYDNNPSNWNYSDRFTFMSSFVSSSSSSASSSATSTSSAATSTSAATTSAPTTSTVSTSGNSTTTMETSSTKKPTSSSSSASSVPTSDGAPPSAGSTTISSPLAVIMAVLAAAIFIH
ncbi:hypothetical protein TWF694_008401 [Orbilia ellipsospora]|uniref:Yeast cell wall synthesis Kre9/Knh1-like N-terminal domain-containing protein n=1 Tax=Orbilia ellipsospora TaxID=2528407 RepID=A0AAV9XGE4_9PEZI